MMADTLQTAFAYFHRHKQTLDSKVQCRQNLRTITGAEFNVFCEGRFVDLGDVEE